MMNNTGLLRIFIGLKVEPGLAKLLAELARPLKSNEVRLVPSDDIHLTLVPPWSEADLTGAVETLRKTVCGSRRFLLTFQHLRYGPTLRHPHLLWAECVPSRELMELRAVLAAAFGQVDPRPFRPHVTLARLPKNSRAIVRKIAMDQTLSFSQSVTSVELFQSPSQGGSGYQILASSPLDAEPQLSESP